MPRGILLNLALAVAPVILGYGLAWGLGRRSGPPYLKLLLGLPVALVWLALLPHTCYLLTEWRALLLHSPLTRLVEGGAQGSPGVMLGTAKWALYFLGYSTAGMLLLALAIRPLEQWLRASGKQPLFLAPFLFFLVSLGVYLSLAAGVDTRDLFSRPILVLHTTHKALTSAALLLSIGVFGALLWAVYEGVDVWVDGMADRLRRFVPGGKGSAGKSAPRPAAKKAR